jgi:hypothetical protein
MQTRKLKALVRRLDKEWNAAVKEERKYNNNHPSNVKGHKRLYKKVLKAADRYKTAKNKLKA